MRRLVFVVFGLCMEAVSQNSLVGTTWLDLGHRYERLPPELNSPKTRILEKATLLRFQPDGRFIKLLCSVLERDPWGKYDPWVSGIIIYGGSWTVFERGIVTVDYRLEQCSTCRGWTPKLQAGKGTALLKSSPERLLFEGKTFLKIRINTGSEQFFR